MEKEQMNQTITELFHFMNNKGVGFICYIWDREGKFGGGCQSASADMGDAMVAIGRIIKHFNISPEALFLALKASKTQRSEV